MLGLLGWLVRLGLLLWLLVLLLWLLLLWLLVLVLLVLLLLWLWLWLLGQGEETAPGRGRNRPHLDSAIAASHVHQALGRLDGSLLPVLQAAPARPAVLAAWGPAPLLLEICLEPRTLRRRELRQSLLLSMHVRLIRCPRGPSHLSPRLPIPNVADLPSAQQQFRTRQSRRFSN